MQIEDLIDTHATEALGGALIDAIGTAPAVVWLLGELGSGKTTLVRGALRALGFREAVKSPTYTLVEPYSLPHRSLYHFDLYRLGAGEELEYLGIRDYLSEPEALLFIEWPEQGEGWTPAADLQLELHYHGRGRRARLTPCSPRGEQIVARL
ncbi:tRNA (adenosine(37)-N6)-threonylcarbamoyltransferase complex ATPase subunit type 1 TsaE [Ectothiorhodospiraceae bacterium BW-2]|nr:tRNA (adenosine(37)-N6)-threonylcarbamoyltransferase complex ATPase subunit type 1 TsaE [Ectothiorhodospiraceae bacterium BW-2]